MLGAAVVLAASSPQMLRGALIQGLPPLVFLLGAVHIRSNWGSRSQFPALTSANVFLAVRKASRTSGAPT